ncbi:Acetyltransferase (GNAT) domain-containing protein [Octadecabacter temperatus]|uniref:FemAB family protein n=1 Tax=Octadecabacter temperatus TaxID=1458307 RepID=A0A0K0Y5E2_9RHOB|nr:GNAT family N-acetyltransferase [Octadecabacter temperatus]AKS46184.1 FemAB family protein [Octadecabacter temperatus]SIO09201.1 Acetyltransferase (GNAT) domain-containing protein [Octadecabacter temperatus]
MSDQPNVPLQQSPQFARALQAYGSVVEGTDPVILKRRFGRLGSIAFASRATPESIAETAVRLLNGETPCPRAYRDAGFRQIITPSHIAEWDLTRPDLRAALHPKWRNQLIKGEKQNVRVCAKVWDGSPHELFIQAARLGRQRGFSSYPFNLLAAFAQRNAGDAVIFAAFSQQTLIGACLILRHGTTATYQTAWASETGKALQAPRLLLWRAASDMADLGHGTLDLGCIETDRSAGLARFKLGTGAQVRQLGGTWVRFRPGAKKRLG